MKHSSVKHDDLPNLNPLTENQGKAFRAWGEGDHLALVGTAGTGKTYLAMLMALQSITHKTSPQEKIVIVRSVVPTRDMGFLPGAVEEKTDGFETPYKNIISEIISGDQSYKRLKHTRQLEFLTTSFIRGITLRDSIVIIDEMQNLNFHELDSVMTRVGNNCRLIFCGDYLQSDFKEGGEREGFLKFMTVVDQLKNFTTITFGWDDIVRSGFVRDYIMTKELLGLR